MRNAANMWAGCKAGEGLDERERYIVEKRLMSDEPETLQEIGDVSRIDEYVARAKD